MNKINRKTNYFLGIVFLLIGFVFLSAGLWNVAGSLADDSFIAYAVVALSFLLLFAMVAIIYSLFLFRSGKGDAAIVERVHPVSVASLLAFGLAPLLFVYLSTQSRELNNRRQAAFLEIRPAFMQYVIDHGKAPRNLHQLVPGYISVLPEAIILSDDVSTNKWVRYQPGNNTALLCYKAGGILAAETCYDIAKDRYQ